MRWGDARRLRASIIIPALNIALPLTRRLKIVTTYYRFGLPRHPLTPNPGNAVSADDCRHVCLEITTLIKSDLLLRKASKIYVLFNVGTVVFTTIK